MIKASKRRFISLVVVAAMIIGLLPLGAMTAFAAPRTMVLAASTPSVVANANAQAAGNITISEDTDTAADWGSGQQTFVLTLPAGIKFNHKPTVTISGGAGSVIDSAVLSGGGSVLTILAEGNNSARDIISITDIQYDVAGVSAGDVTISTAGSSLANIDASVVNAKVTPGLGAATIPATSTAKVEAGKNNQAADQIVLTESDTSTVKAGKKITLTVNTTGVTFSSAPSVAVTNGLAVSGGTIGGSGTSVSYTVNTASTTQSATYTFSDIMYDVAAGTASGTVTVGLSTDATDTSNALIPISPSSVKNAQITVGGTTISAASIPTLKKNTNNQAAGNITITENAFGNLSTGEVTITLPANVTFYGAPEATSTGGIKLQSTVATVTGGNVAHLDITQASTSTPGSIVISNIKYSVAAGAASGPVSVAIGGSAGAAGNVVNAIIETSKTATVSAPVQMIIPASAEAIEAGDIIIKESDKGKLAATKVIQLELEENNFNVNEVFFAEAPTIQITSGNIIVGPVTLSPDRTIANFTVTSASTVASTIKITDIKYNTLGSAQGAVFVHVFYDAESLGMISNAFVGTVEPTFADVPVTHFAFNAVEFLASAGIVSGRTSGDFDPNDSITRGEFAKIICLAAGLTPITGGTPSFSDTSGHWAAGYIEAAKAAGLVGGYPDGTFRPNNLVTRAEIAKMVVEAAGFATNTSGAGFTDIEGNWAKDFILTAANNGIVNGYNDGTFRPNNTATRAEASVMVFNWLAN